MQKLTAYVTVFHILLIAILCYNITPPPLDIPQKFAVKTISLVNDSVTEIQTQRETAPKVEQKKEEPPKKESKKEIQKVEPKKETPKKEVPKQTTKISKPIAKEPTPLVKKSDKLEQAKKALSNLKSTPSSASSSPSPKTIELQIEGALGQDRYFSTLISTMQTVMKFPESGEVIVELTLAQSGKVMTMSIKEAKSILNKMYVEKTLPSIKFPMFEGSLKHENSHTFVVVLNSLSMD